MFADLNHELLAEQRGLRHTPEHALAVRGADRLLSDLGMMISSLPCHFRVDASTFAALARATRLLADAQDKLLAHLCATRSAGELVAMFEVPPDMARRLDWRAAPSAGMRMLRADIIPVDDGYRFCEINHFAGVGGGEAYHSAHLYAELLGRPVTGVSPFRELALQYVAECRRAGLTRVVVLDAAEHRRLGFGENLLMRRYMHLMAPDLEVAYHDEVSYPRRWLEPEEARRTLVHRLFTFEDTSDGAAFLGTVRDSGATVSSMFEAELKMHRRWLALLCDPAYRHLLTDEELSAIERYVPHTFVVTPGGVDAAVADKDRLVFKRSYSYGGKGVVVGDQHEPGPLRDLLTREGVTWVAQRRVHVSTVDLPGADGRVAPFNLVLGLYLYGNRASGLLVRGSVGSPVVNVSQGGGMSWAFVQ